MSKEIKAIIEIPTNSWYKYETDKFTGKLKLDRPLTDSIPYNYGYLVDTLAPDGDPLDVCIIDNPPIYPLTEVTVVPVGVLICDDNGVSDDKIIAVLKDSQFIDTVKYRIEEIRHFLSHYKYGFNVLDHKDADEAIKIYNVCVATNYSNKCKDGLI